MHFFKVISALTLLLLALGSVAEATDQWSKLVNPEQAKSMADSLNEPGVIQPSATVNQQDASFMAETADVISKYKDDNKEALKQFSQGEVEKQVQPYMTDAEALSKAALEGARTGMQSLGMSTEQSNNFGDATANKTGDEYAIFISFSMSDAEIKDAFRTAASAGAHVYLKGLKKGHTTITETMKELRKLAVGMDTLPQTRFNPELFERFSVSQVPFILYQNSDGAFTAKGIMNLRWLKGHSLDDKDPGDLGVYGPTYPVEETSIVEMMKSKMAAYDWESQKKKTIETFWQRQTFEKLPPSMVDQVWFINPTVRVTADVKNPRGDVLAKAGDVINPLNTPLGMQNFVVFDATDVRQIEWATKIASSNRNKGPVILMTSQIDPKKGWDHLEVLRTHFKSDVYLLPKELVKRFKFTALPVFITPDLSKKVFRVEQFNMEDIQ